MNNPTPLQTLIIEDHPFIVEGYIRILKNIASEHDNLEFKIKTAKDCEEAHKQIELAINHYLIDLVFLDINLPPTKDKSFISGDDLGLKLRTLFPKVKIIVATHLNDNYRLLNILKRIKPNGLTIKSEFTSNSITQAVLNVINDVPYYSNEILKLLKKYISNDYDLDDIDRKILYHLSQGVKTKELINVIHLSQSGIENRKRKLNQIFNIEKKSDKTLIKLAKEKGFI